MRPQSSKYRNCPKRNAHDSGGNHMRNSLRLAGVAGLLCMAATTARSDAFDAYRVACDAGQNAIASAAVVEARSMLSDTINSLPTTNSASGAKFKRWFGGNEGDDDPVLKQVSEEVLGFMVFQSYWCPNKTMPDDDPGTLAFVPKGGFSEIFLESGFFDLSDKGADSRGGTIVHEASHQATSATIVDTDVTGDGKPDYTIADAEQLARTEPQKARRTANNLEYFAEDIVAGIP
ncbi:hypothetical protein CK226_20745 [Mesorhizobium sp. WSM4311]|nr:hypothetical protein CK226_20745 [Mesorhizobium sp. WSM4311]TRD04806.1 hypothetical protein FJV82_13195 [Mesorhizobium sp. WSM4305]